MKKEQWFEDQPVLKDDLVRAQSTKEQAISERLLDAFNYGTVENSQQLGETGPFIIAQGPNPGLFITVNSGLAYSPAGERSIIPSILAFNSSSPSATTDNGIGGTTLTPQSTGSQNIPVANNTTNYVWLGYLLTTDPTVFTLKEDTNERLFVKQDDGYQITTTTVSTNPDITKYVLLGEVVTVSGAVTAINTANTKEAKVVGPTPIPSTPFQITLPAFPNLPAEDENPASIPSVTGGSGFTYTAGAPAVGQFTVNFSTGIITFNSADTGISVTINYLAQHTRRPFSVTKSGRVGGVISAANRPAVYETGLVTTFTDHVNAKGSGVVSPTNPHGTSAVDIGLAGVLDIGGKLASSGIITPTGDASSTTSSLSPAAVSAFLPADNKVIVAPLIAGESVNINGTIITPLDIPATLEFLFIDPITLLPISAGTYTIYIDPVTKTVNKILGAAPAGAFSIASIVWDGSKLLLPLTDLRFFGTTASSNIRLETLLALVTGSATDDRLTNIYSARLIGSVAVTSPSYAFTGLGGTTFIVNVDGTPSTATFPALPVNTTLSSAVNTINAQITGIKAVATPANSIKILGHVSLVVTGGTGASILGFPISPAPGSSDSGDIKEIRITGSSSSIGSQGISNDADISFTYDLTPNLIQVDAAIGNRLLTTVLTYNADNSIKTIQEIVA